MALKKKVFLLGFIVVLAGCSSEKEVTYESKMLEESSPSVEESVAFVAEKIELTPPDTVDPLIDTASNDDGFIGIFKNDQYAQPWYTKKGEQKTPIFTLSEMTDEMTLVLKEVKMSEFQVCYVDGELLMVLADESLPKSYEELTIAGGYYVDLTEHAEVGEHIIQVFNFGRSGDFAQPEIVYSTTYIVE